MTDNFYAPPHSIEAEQAVIGGLLLDDEPPRVSWRVFYL